MYIDTSSKETMSKDMADLLGISEYELTNYIRSAYKKTDIDRDARQLIFESEIEKLIELLPRRKQIDEVLVYHLSRRLIGTEDNATCENLFTMLTTENPTSIFLKNHGVEFKIKNNSITIINCGKEVCLDDSSNYREGTLENRARHYFQSRFGQTEFPEDYCFNGFLLGDRLIHNNYFRSLSRCPECVDRLSMLLQNNDIKEDFYKNSKYYCYIYKIPIAEVIFTKYETLSDVGKEMRVLQSVLWRLCEYLTSKFCSDEDNPIVRLPDTAHALPSWLVENVKIDWL